MALAHTILALLVDMPSSGYELMKTFETSVGFFWKATHQQVYRELARMEEQDWVEATVVAQESRPDKKVYQVTEAGKQALTAWMQEPCEVAPVKDEILVKIFAGSLVKPEVLRHELERHRQLHQKKLDTYQTLEASYFSAPQTMPLQKQFHYLTLRRGIRYEMDCIAWCDEALEFLALEPPLGPLHPKS